MRSIARNILIHARPAKVWRSLTDPADMKQWMGEPEMNLGITTDWIVGHNIITRGFHSGAFETRGVVLAFSPDEHLRYSHLSSISQLPDVEANHAVLDFRLEPLDQHTSLMLTIENFATESIFKHLDFYWRGTLEILRRHVEG